MIEGINAILQKNDLGCVRAASVHVTRSELKTAHDVLTAVKEFAPSEGWLCFTDEVLVIRKGTLLPSLDGRVILSGELASGTQSIHIRQSGACWEHYLLHRQEGGEQVMVEESFITIPKGEKSKLKYEIYWQADAQGVLAPFASRFVGFEQGGLN